MLKIRLMRIGAKKRPFYRVVAVDERAKRTGAFIENLGTYNPLTQPHEIKLKQDRIDYWTQKGAQMSDGFLRIIGKAPQRPPRKPKKEQPADSSASAAAPAEGEAQASATEEAPAEPQEETPSQEAQPAAEEQAAPEAPATEESNEESSTEAPAAGGEESKE